MRRVNQAYVIATTTKVQLPDTMQSILGSIDDGFFTSTKKRSKHQQPTSNGQFFEGDTKVAGNGAGLDKDTNAKGRAEKQQEVDTALLPAIKEMGNIFTSYLHTPFSLTNGQYPHMLRF
uniref:60S ribosomal protein L6 n=1 Tax=Lygus hesperus TaxID=30085 RepID=A0A0A9XEA4_LYGHE